MEEEVLNGKTLLVVDDESDLREIVASELEFMGAQVHQAENISIAQDILNKHSIDLIVSDIRMPGGTGIDLLDAVKARNENVPPVILITGFADITLEDALNKGAEALLNKPFKLDDLIKLVVRYTSPFAVRYGEKEDAIKTLVIDGQAHGTQVGRGGLSFTHDLDAQRIDVGESLNFELALDGNHLSGCGVCRWIRPIETHKGQAVVGLEITYLSQDSLSSFEKLFQGRKIIPYIPHLGA